MTHILSDRELQRLTGSSNPEIQRQVLTETRIPYVTRRDRKVVVTWEMVNQAKLNQVQSVTLGTAGGASINLPEGFNLAAAAGR